MTEEATSEAILRAIRRLLQQGVAHSRSVARETGLGMTQLLCLRAVYDLPPSRCTVVHVAEYADLSAPTASRILARLVDGGFLRREHTPSDRRKVFLALTELGRSKLDARWRVLYERFAQRFENLDLERRRQLLSSLEQVVEMMSPDAGADSLPPEVVDGDPEDASGTLWQ